MNCEWKTEEGTNVREALIVYGLRRLAEATGGKLEKLADKIPDVALPLEPVWALYEAVLAGGRERPPEEVLTCIFSLVSTDGGQPEQRFYSARPLALEREVRFTNPRA